MIASLHELYFRFRGFILLVQTKQVQCSNGIPLLSLSSQTSQK